LILFAILMISFGGSPLFERAGRQASWKRAWYQLGFSRAILTEGELNDCF
jgi:hypothetical protein